MAEVEVHIEGGEENKDSWVVVESPVPPDAAEE